TQDFVFRGCSTICSSIDSSSSCLSDSCGYLQSSSTRLNTIARSLAETSFQYTPRLSLPCPSSSVLPHQIPSVYLLLFSFYSTCFLPITVTYSQNCVHMSSRYDPFCCARYSIGCRF